MNSDHDHAPIPGALGDASPQSAQLLALVLCPSGGLDLRALWVLLDGVARSAWMLGYRQALDRPPARAPGAPLPCGLTEREVAVLRLVAIGRSNKEIGLALSISRSTVASHLRSILNKTFTANRTEAAAFASREGLLVDVGRVRPARDRERRVS